MKKRALFLIIPFVIAGNLWLAELFIKKNKDKLKIKQEKVMKQDEFKKLGEVNKDSESGDKEKYF